MLEKDKIYLGDCFEMLKEIDDKSVDLVVTDPPYLHDNGNWLKSGKAGKKSILGNSDTFSENGQLFQEMSAFGEKEIEALLKELIRVCKIPNIYLFCSEEQVPIYGMWAREHGLHYNILVWEKPLMLINKNAFSHNTEYVVRIYDFGTGLRSVSKSELYNKVIHDQRVKVKHHPTEKPSSIFERFILLNSNEGDLVLDPFSGSGVCAEACAKTNRHYVCIEKNAEHYDYSVKRMRMFNAQLKLF